MNNKRFVVHEFLIGSPILIDRVNNTLTFYDHNIYGQIYNLKNPKHHVINTRKMNGLIQRTHNPDYGFYTSKAVDGYIYEYLMTPEQQAKCRRTPDIPGWNDFITVTNDFCEAIREMCRWVYEREYRGELGDKDAQRGRLLKYCEDYLAERPTEPPSHEQAMPQRKSHDRGDR